MNVHEYQAKELLAKFGLNIPKGKLCYTATEAEWAARSFGLDALSVVKAQIHAGGRGKGGGVKLARTPEEANEWARKIIGMQLVTPQTGHQGKKVHKVLVAQGSDIAKEYYLSLVVNREADSIGVMASTEGGMASMRLQKNTPRRLSPPTSTQPLVSCPSPSV